VFNDGAALLGRQVRSDDASGPSRSIAKFVSEIRVAVDASLEFNAARGQLERGISYCAEKAPPGSELKGSIKSPGPVADVYGIEFRVAGPEAGLALVDRTQELVEMGDRAVVKIGRR